MRNPAPILHVEDNEDDQFFLKRAFAAAGIANDLLVVDDGQKAIDYLSGQGDYADRQKFALPCLVILDLKLPRIHGLEVLKWIRAHEEFKTIIVIIFSSSPLRNDVDTAYKTGSNSFIVKPLGVDQMTQIAQLIKAYWLETNEFPSVSAMDDPFSKLRFKPPPGLTGFI